MSLQIDYNQLRREIGRKLAIERNPDFFEPDEIQDVEDILSSGLRRFYWHAVLPVAEGAAAAAHSWSFLRPVRTLALVAAQSTYELPEDFGELIEPVFTWAASAGNAPIAVVSERHLRSLASQAGATGAPKYAALRPVANEAGGIQRHEVVFYPTPTAAAVLSYRSSIIPGELSADRPYPLGGAQHSETILESCLAAAEKTLHDEEGLHAKRYLECLAASIESDKKLTALEDAEIWPLENPIDGLKVNKAHLRRLIGRQLQLGTHPAAWTHKQTSDVQLALEAGLRKFYTAHDWSFLKPLHHLITKSGVYEYDLPADFAMLDGPLTYDPESAILYPPVTVVGEHQIRHYLQREEASARPLVAATSLKSLATGATSYSLLLWPVADGTYGLRFRYSSNPIALGEEVALPFGGQFHAQTIIESCLAAAELQAGIAEGPHTVEAAQLLGRSIAHDQKVNSPSSLGYNSDRSDRGRGEWTNHHEYSEQLVTYTGYTPG